MTVDELTIELDEIQSNYINLESNYYTLQWGLTLMFVGGVLLTMIIIPFGVGVMVSVLITMFYLSKKFKKANIALKGIEDEIIAHYKNKLINKEEGRYINYKAHFDACVTQAAVDATFSRYYNVTSKNFEDLQVAYDRASRRVQ